jgi:signal transduction histidine kinase
MESTINVLAVDDVPQNLAAIEAVLTQRGLSVIKASSGTQALELLLLEEVALALVDVQMPGMDGFELAELMRGAERTRNVPIIFMTAASHDPSRTFRGYEAGAVDFLYKPVDPQILKSKVEVFVELYSQRRKLSAQLDELRNALRLNEMFAAVLSHDLRNPLNAISLGTEMLLRTSSDPTVVATAERLRSSTRRMAKMIEQLLDVARIRAGGVQLTMQSSDVSKVCVTIRDELERAGGPPRIALTVSGDTRATFDVDRLSQVVSNLVGNALQHGEPDSPVSVAVNGADPALVSVRIGNQGVIAPEKMKSLFQPFHSGSTSRGGLGLGLYIANQFVQAHGGRVEASSSPDHQTLFEFSIPRKPPAGNERAKLTL